MLVASAPPTITVRASQRPARGPKTWTKLVIHCEFFASGRGAAGARAAAGARRAAVAPARKTKSVKRSPAMRGNTKDYDDKTQERPRIKQEVAHTIGIATAPRGGF